MKQDNTKKTNPSPPSGSRGDGTENITFLPINLNIRQRHILLIGGGKVAYHKASLLYRFTEHITLLSPRFEEQFSTLPFRYIRKRYEPADLDGFDLLYICTDDPVLNREIKEEASQRGMLASVCDSPELCDFTSPAIYRLGNLTISVATDAREVKRSIAIRNRIQTLIENGTLSVD
ncbi:MAG: bifunctional precorrin-2 dehydrogenase/sirohydrochlorin ferrochelatase [Tannerellaceae bacterium]|nr:bifunctional precorrin-2 dehydrogenase/sirohydrochlorin ferrochelatase [Tannerellaceae bacterium]